MRKIESVVIGTRVAGLRVPMASNSATLPWRATSSTAPGMTPFSTSFLSVVVIRARRSDDSPTCSGLALGRLWAWAAVTVSTNSRAARNATFVLIGGLLCGGLVNITEVDDQTQTWWAADGAVPPASPPGGSDRCNRLTMSLSARIGVVCLFRGEPAVPVVEMGEKLRALATASLRLVLDGDSYAPE